MAQKNKLCYNNERLKNYRNLKLLLGKVFYSARKNFTIEKQFCNMGLYQVERGFLEEIVGINDYIIL